MALLDHRDGGPSSTPDFGVARGGSASDGHIAEARPQFPDNAAVRALHERFVNDPNNTDLSSLRPTIARSWLRSVKWDVDPDLRTFEKYREPRVDDQTMQVAAPVLAELERIAADTGVTIYLADQDGTIVLQRAGDNGRTASRYQVANPGGAMSEDVCGTNSDGTAIEEGRAVHVWGAEHFCTGMQHLYCTSVPIVDPMRRSVRAVLSLSMPENMVREADIRSMALIARGAAAELTQLLAARLAVREQALLSSYLAEVRKRGAESVVVMDDRTTIASKGALHMLGQSDYAVLAGYARESERSVSTVEREVTLGPDTTLRVLARPITSGGETIGSVLRLRQPNNVQQARRRKVVARRNDRFTALIGDSLALRRALEVATTVVRKRMPAYILGERGTGKSLLAEAMSRQLGEQNRRVDCARGDLAEPAAMEALSCDLRSGAWVVIRHVDALDREQRDQLTELMSNLESPTVVLTLSRLRDDLMALMAALGGVEIDMPPLRSRRDDIPLLVAHFLASAAHGVMRVSPALLGSLTEADWTGNVTHLKEFVDTAAARCNFSELGTHHLGDAHQRTIARNPLSRLEEAELQQIREALALTDGNRLRAAELLQIGRSTLYRKIETYTRRGYQLQV